MLADKLLAEWFWIDRWMGSSAFGLPIDARGLYREMLTQAWRRSARLPNNHDQIRRLTGVTLKEWRRTWPLVERFWREEGDSLVNDTQLEIYADAQARSARASERGLKGAQAKHKHSTRSAQAQPEHKPLSLSLSPSPSPVTNRREEKIQRTEPLDEAWARILTDYPQERVEKGRIVQDGFIAACLEVGVDGVFARLESHKRSEQWRKGMVPRMGNYFGEKQLWRQALPEHKPTDHATRTGMLRDATEQFLK